MPRNVMFPPAANDTAPPRRWPTWSIPTVLLCAVVGLGLGYVAGQGAATALTSEAVQARPLPTVTRLFERNR